jgi:hypothetical protein
MIQASAVTLAKIGLSNVTTNATGTANSVDIAIH